MMCPNCKDVGLVELAAINYQGERLWCPECRTAWTQQEVDSHLRASIKKDGERMQKELRAYADTVAKDLMRQEEAIILGCVQPHAPDVDCVECGNKVHTCESGVLDNTGYRCPVHPKGAQIGCGAWVCSTKCWDTIAECGTCDGGQSTCPETLLHGHGTFCPEPLLYKMQKASEGRPEEKMKVVPPTTIWEICKRFWGKLK